MATLDGSFGRATIENDWTVQGGRIRDHALAVVGLERLPVTFAA